MAADIRILTTPAEFNRIPAMEVAVWGLPPLDVVSGNIIRALTLNGGVAHGAFDGEAMIGMSLAFSAWRSGKRFLWSHMAAVLPEYQGQGIGFQLKQAQRKWALAQGVDEMRWTFDPIQRGNAHFNLHLLGVTSSTYHVDFYGQMEDALNVAAPTDRLEAVWKLKDKRVVRLASGENPTVYPAQIPAGAILLSWGEGGRPVIGAGSANSPGVNSAIRMQQMAALGQDVFIELPPNREAFKALAPAEVLAWRLALRAELSACFSAGFTAVDLVEQNGRSYYRLDAPQAWCLYVLECRDGSLYTGIARDPETRALQHNAGRGAAYTAARRPVRLVAVWQFYGRGAALQAEAAFKAQSRADKLALIAAGTPYRGADRRA